MELQKGQPSHARARPPCGGDELRTLEVRRDRDLLRVGVQICRELVFAEQWQYLAGAGAQAFVYLTYAVNPAQPAGVWRSHLISRAAANQRFVIAANVADPRQHCPSMIIAPSGSVLAELPAGPAAMLRATIDTSDVSSWYLDQRRTDVLDLRYRGS
jgi:omega-amidase